MRTIEEELEAIWADVPDSAWDLVPADLTDRLDYYLYDEPYEEVPDDGTGGKA